MDKPSIIIELEHPEFFTYRNNRQRRYYETNADTLKTARQQRYEANADDERKARRERYQEQKVSRLRERLHAS